MRFYARRIKEFEQTQKFLRNLGDFEGSIAVLGMRLLLPLAEHMKNAAIQATSFNAYKLQKSHRKIRVLKEGEYYVFEPKRYLKLKIDADSEDETKRNINRLNRRYNSYISKARKTNVQLFEGVGKNKYPYSKRKPRPPINPALVNIQTGHLNRSFEYTVRPSKTEKFIELRMSNLSPHFYFITSSTDSKASKMMPRPLLDLLHVKFRKLYQAEIPRFYTMFQKTVYRGITNENAR